MFFELTSHHSYQLTLVRVWEFTVGLNFLVLRQPPRPGAIVIKEPDPDDSWLERPLAICCEQVTGHQLEYAMDFQRQISLWPKAQVLDMSMGSLGVLGELCFEYVW